MRPSRMQNDDDEADEGEVGGGQQCVVGECCQFLIWVTLETFVVIEWLVCRRFL